VHHNAEFCRRLNRPDGPVGNDWLNTTGNVGGDLVIRNGTLSTPGADGEAGVYRAVDLSGPLTVSATFTQGNGFGGLLNRYVAAFLFGSTGAIGSGYGIVFGRGDQNYSDSSVDLVLDGVELAIVPSSFQYGASISVTVTLSPNGSVSGSIAGSGSTFDFTFPPRAVSLAGTNLAIVEQFPDPRSGVITNPTVDNLTITYSCGGP